MPLIIAKSIPLSQLVAMCFKSTSKVTIEKTKQTISLPHTWPPILTIYDVFSFKPSVFLRFPQIKVPGSSLTLENPTMEKMVTKSSKF